MARAPSPRSAVVKVAAVELDLPLLGEARATPLRYGGGDLVVVSFPAGRSAVDPDAAQLTPVEHEIVVAILLGWTNREIARARGRSVRTVTTQVSRIYAKVGVSSRAELARWAMGALSVTDDVEALREAPGAAPPAARVRRRR